LDLHRFIGTDSDPVFKKITVISENAPSAKENEKYSLIKYYRMSNCWLLFSSSEKRSFLFKNLNSIVVL
jgi:hypothetical protein